MLCIYVNLGVENFDKSKLVKAKHPSNIEYIVVTDAVDIESIFKYFNELHDENVFYILITLLV